MLKCGLLGKKLGHSYSPQIHGMLADYEYLLYEKSEEELEDFVKNGSWRGLNVTIPYKKDVLPFCNSLSETAAATGSVNTLTKDENGLIRGDNTDVYGFTSLVWKSGIVVGGKKTLVLGNGGAAASVVHALKKMGADVTVISRRGEDNYENISRHSDAQVIVNTTPVGMYPGNGTSPLSLDIFPELTGVLDIIYNPARTALLLQAEKRGIRCENGLYMLVAQAKKSSEAFTGERIPDDRIESVTENLAFQMSNLVLIGMPGSGKSTIAKALSEMTGRAVVDTDEEVVEAAEMSIPEIMERFGQEDFRNRETEAIREAGKQSGVIISTGGGCVLFERNKDLLRQNGRIFWIQRDTDLLARRGRPLSKGADLDAMYKEREPYYRDFADAEILNDTTQVDAAVRVLSSMQ